MRITKVQCTMVSVPLNRPASFATRTVKKRDYTIVEISTDEGIVGVSTIWWHHTAMIIENHLKDLIIGEDPFFIENIWRKIYLELYRERKGAAICAISGVDIALWDIIGKAMKIPLYKLLGGFKSKVHCYASGGYYREGKGLKELAEEMISYVNQGFKAVKMKVGALSIEKDVERVKAVRDAIGPDIDLAIDANNAYTVKEAIKAGKLYGKHNVLWFEEPVWPDDIKGSAKVANFLDMPIASGELEYTRYGFKDIIENRAADILQPDVTFCGGITEFLKIAKMAEAWNIPIAPHAAHDIHVHLVAALPNALTVEYFLKDADIMREMELYKRTIEPKNGYLEVPNEPGLGIELDEKAIKRYHAR